MTYFINVYFEQVKKAMKKQLHAPKTHARGGFPCIHFRLHHVVSGTKISMQFPGGRKWRHKEGISTDASPLSVEIVWKDH